MTAAPSLHASERPLDVVFDVGRVLIDWDLWHLYRHFFDDREAFDAFLRETDLLAFNLECDRGLTFAEATEAMKSRAPHHIEAIHAFDTRWGETIPGPIQGSVDLMARLQTNGVRCFAITNFSAEKWPIARTRFPFLDAFDGLVVSGDVRLIKPDAAIFQRLMDDHGLDPTQCVFIDDAPINVAGARSVGMDAILFEDPRQLGLALKKRGLPI